MPLYRITLGHPSEFIVVTDSGSVAWAQGFEEDSDRILGFKRSDKDTSADVSTEFAIERSIDITGLYPVIELLGQSGHASFTTVSGFEQVNRYTYKGRVRFVPDTAVAGLLTDPAFYTGGAVYRDVAATHGIDSDDFDALTLGAPQAITWNEARGFVPSGFGQELIAASKTV